MPDEKKDNLKNYMSEASFATFRKYLGSRAENPFRYLVESSVSSLFSWIPGVSGMLARALAYRFLLGKGSSLPFIEPGCELLFMNRIKLGGSVYIDRNCRLHASRASIEIGLNSRIMRNSYLCTCVSNPREGEGIRTGKSCWIGINVVLVSGQGGIFLGDNVLIAPNVTIATGNHDSARTDLAAIEQEYSGKPIHIHDNVWIGANSVIVGGVTIGERAVVGAGSVVTKDVEPYSIVGGVPAMLIRRLK